jgi:hypothetical protein
MFKKALGLFLFAAIVLISCSKTDDNNPTDGTTKLTVKKVVDLWVDTMGVFTYYSLKNNAVVPAKDSNTTNWDIAFYKTTIYSNSGVRGPGLGGIQALKNTDFSTLTEAPESGYGIDTSRSKAALPTGSGNGWYNYNGATNAITPIPGIVIALKTAEGKYAKIMIKSYYKGSPEQIDANSLSKFYTFDFVYQPDGTRKF